MKKSIQFFMILALFMLSASVKLSAQVGINNNAISATGSAMLDITSSDKGLLIPRMSTQQRDLIPSPAAGLVIYNTTTNQFNYFNGIHWYSIETTFVSSVTGSLQTGGGVAISASPNPVPDSAAMLDASDTQRGFLLTRTTPQAIASPENGLIIFDIQEGIIKYFYDNQWYPVCAVTTGVAGATGTQPSAGMAISTTAVVAHPSAIVDVFSPNKGILIPRLTSQERDLIAAKPGLAIFNTTGKAIEYFNGSEWQRMNTVVPAGVSITASESTVCAGIDVTFTATPVNGGQSPAYQWKVNNSDVQGATNTTFTYPPAHNDVVKCVMTSSLLCVSGNPATSNEITLAVTSIPPVSITITPSANPSCENSQVTFTSSISYGGNSPAYQWYLNSMPVSGATNPTYTHTCLNDDVIRCFLTSNETCAPSSPVSSNVITMVVNPLLPASVSIAAVPAGAICDGTSVTFTATPVNGGTGPTYQWMKGANPIPGATNATYSSTTLANGDVIKVVMTSNATPCLTGSPATSNTIAMTVHPLPAVNPVSNPMWCNGANTTALTFSSPVSGATFDWTNNNPAIGLASAGTGGLPVFTAVNGGTTNATASITVTATANGCSGAPYSFTITVYPTPSATQVSNKIYCNGASVPVIAFSGPVAGTTFQWSNTNPSIGLPASGIGNLPVFTASNTGTVPAVGQITVTPVANGCTGTPVIFTITVNPTPTATQVTNKFHCNGAAAPPVTLTGPVAGTTFAWTNNNPSIGLASSGTGDVPNFMATNTGTAPVVATITVVPSANGCQGTPMNFNITVYPTPTVNQVNDVAYCNGATTTPIVFGSPVAGTTYSWVNDTPSIGLAATGNGNLPSFQAVNTGSATVTATITVTPTANGCTGTPSSFVIRVYPTPTVTPVTNKVYCNNTSVAPITFSSPVSGATFAWTNSNPSIGLPATGTGDLPAFTTSNTGITPQIATITVTPSANGCTGTPFIFTITVQPTPTFAAVPDQFHCNGATTTPVTFSGSVAGTHYDWVNDNTSIGLQASGIGDIPSFIATNPGTAPLIAHVTVTPTANGCQGISQVITITVYPTTTVNQVTSVDYCNGANTAQIVFGSPVAGTTYAWTNNTPSIGLAASGSGNVPSFQATNTGTSTVTATITVTPTANGCTGTPSTFTITVFPTPVVNQLPVTFVCDGLQTLPIIFSGPVAGTTYTWTNSDPSIGLPPAGNGDIQPFIAHNVTNNIVTATITVTPHANGCTGAPMVFQIVVYPTPKVDQVADAFYCNGASTVPIPFTGPVNGTSFAWTNSDTSIGLAPNGTSAIPSFTATNTGTAPVTAMITVVPTANGCTGIPMTFSITVYPTPTVDQVNNQVYCNLDNTIPVNFTNPVAGTTYAWTNSDPSIGLPATGTGDIPSFIATNPGIVPVTSTVTVTPTANGCIGVPMSFTITVNPTPTVNTVNNAIYCNGATTTAISFSGPVSGTTFSWTNSAPSIGLAATGTGDIPSFVATNTGTSPVVATITVTPSANGCTGTPLTFTVTVNHSLPVSITINPSANNVCAGVSVTFSSTIVNGGTTPLYQWKKGGNNITGATNATYTYVPVNGDVITCQLTSNATCATGTPALSNTVTMQVVPLVPVKAFITASQYNMMPGTTVNFSCAVTNGGTNPTYQWKKNGTNISGATTNAYSYVPSNLDVITCVVTSNSTTYCLSNNPATSNRNAMVVYVAGSPCASGATVVHGGKTYNTVDINGQCWLRENMDIGNMIPNSTLQTNNSIIEKYCYNDSTYNCDLYGGLYQWNELMQYVTTAGAQGICPTGWHVPTLAETNTLSTFLGGDAAAGGKLKEVGFNHFRSPNASATNANGFTLLPGGYSYRQAQPTPFFSKIQENGYIPTSTQNTGTTEDDYYFRGVIFTGASLSSPNNYKSTAIGVRCLKNP